MNPITPNNSCPKRKEQVIAQRASTEVLLFSMDDGTYYALNEVGSRIWELCDGHHDIEQLVRILGNEYDVPADVLAGDVDELLDELRRGDLIV